MGNSNKGSNLTNYQDGGYEYNDQVVCNELIPLGEFRDEFSGSEEKQIKHI
jgi:hypothetical protein